MLARIADRVALDARPAADERLAVALLELVEARAVDDPGDQLARVDLRAVVVGDQPVELAGIDGGRLRLARPATAAPAELPCRLRTIRRAIASACSSEVA